MSDLDCWASVCWNHILVLHLCPEDLGPRKTYRFDHLVYELGTLLQQLLRQNDAHAPAHQICNLDNKIDLPKRNSDAQPYHRCNYPTCREVRVMDTLFYSYTIVFESGE